MNQKGISGIILIISLVIILGIIFIAYLSFQKYNYYSKLQQGAINQKAVYDQRDLSRPSLDDIQSNRLRECGDIPEELRLKVTREHFEIVKGPLWTEDCKYIVWSKWISGTGGPGIASQSANTHLNEGVFTYVPAIKEYKTIYQPKQNNETPELVNIKDGIVEYKVSNDSYFFNLQTNSQVK